MTTTTSCPQCGEEAVLLADDTIYCTFCGRIAYVHPDNENVDLDEHDY